MLVLNPELISDANAYTQIEREVEKIATVHHDNLLQILGLESIEGASFLTLEWTDGFSALELLRARREIEAGETLLLLKQAALGVDAALAAGLKRLDFALHQVLIHFGQTIDKEKLLRAPLLTWPPFTAKLEPSRHHSRTLRVRDLGWRADHGARRGCGRRGHGHSRTLCAGARRHRLRIARRDAQPAASRRRRGGALHPAFDADRRRQRSAQARARSCALFASAQEFFDALKNIEVLEIKRPQAPPPLASQTRASLVTAHEMAQRSRPALVPKPRKKKIPVKFVGSLLTVGLIGAGVYFLSPRHNQTSGDETPEPTPAPGEFSDSPDVTPPNNDTPAVTVDVPEIPAKPPEQENQAKARQEALRVAIERADETERAGDPEKSIATWLAVAREFPESDAPKKRLDFVIDPLRKRPEILKPEAFAAFKPLLVEAAQLDVLSAVMLLAEALREPNLRESFSWYSYAAARGRGDAYLQMGLILSNGIGGTREPEKSVYYFKLAAENNDPDAKAALAECYLLGKGAAIDAQQGLRWLNEAVEQGSLRAMNRLATGYDNGIYGLTKNPEEAFRLWTKVAETPDRGGQRRQPIGEAHRNLALLYAAGRGTRRDEAQAVVPAKGRHAAGRRRRDLPPWLFLSRWTRRRLEKRKPGPRLDQESGPRRQ
jgi:hypothetical protein